MGFLDDEYTGENTTGNYSTGTGDTGIDDDSFDYGYGNDEYSYTEEEYNEAIAAGGQALEDNGTFGATAWGGFTGLAKGLSKGYLKGGVLGAFGGGIEGLFTGGTKAYEEARKEQIDAIAESLGETYSDFDEETLRGMAEGFLDNYETVSENNSGEWSGNNEDGDGQSDGIDDDNNFNLALEMTIGGLSPEDQELFGDDEDDTEEDADGDMLDRQIWAQFEKRFFTGQEQNETFGYNQYKNKWAENSDTEWNMSTEEGRDNWQVWLNSTNTDHEDYRDGAEKELEDWAKSVGMTPEDARKNLQESLNTTDGNSMEELLQTSADFKAGLSQEYMDKTAAALEMKTDTLSGLSDELVAGRTRYTDNIADYQQLLDEAGQGHIDFLDDLAGKIEAGTGAYTPTRVTTKGTTLNLGLNRGQRNTVQMLTNMSEASYNTAASSIGERASLNQDEYDSLLEKYDKDYKAAGDLYKDSMSSYGNNLSLGDFMDPSKGEMDYLDSLKAIAAEEESRYQFDQKQDLAYEQMINSVELTEQQLKQNEPGAIDYMKGLGVVAPGVSQLVDTVDTFIGSDFFNKPK